MERPYEKLIVWQEAYKLCLKIYTYTAKFPSYELFGLTSQMRRAGYSIPMNIVEGNSKRTPKAKHNFFRIAQASLEELHCESRLALDLAYLTQAEFDDMDDHVQRVSYLLFKLIDSV